MPHTGCITSLVDVWSVAPSSQRRRRQKARISPLLLAHGRLVASPMKEVKVAVEEKEVDDGESEVVEIGESNILGEVDVGTKRYKALEFARSVIGRRTEAKLSFRGGTF